MLAQEIAPTEIGKHANIIKAAQEELANMDVLVCGRCLHAFHFVEEFQAHKEDACEKENSNLKEALDTKPKIWAFSLWKATQLQTRKDPNPANSWALYQNWVKLDDSVREPWVVAGKTIQSFGKIGHGELQDMPVRITKTVVNPNNNNNTANTNNNTVTSGGSPTRKAPAAAAKLPTVALLKDTENEKPKSKPGTPTPPAASSTPAVKLGNRLATRIDPQTNKRTEEAVEKIVAKRYNPRRKTHEYLVKWLERAHIDNTWEATANLERVPHFLQVFEKQLARQKLTREKGLDALKKTTPSGGKIDSPSGSPVTAGGSPGSAGKSRPTRTSKTKAMDQVKQWVTESGAGAGSTSPSSANDDESAPEHEWSVSGKRKLNHNDSSFEGAGLNASTDSMGMDDLDEDMIPSHTVKRLKNGGNSATDAPAASAAAKPKSAVKVNGNASLARAPRVLKMAELIYTEDAAASGMVRKADVPNSLHVKKDKQEGLVRQLTRAEMMTSNTGIVRLDKPAAAAAAASASPVPVPQKASPVLAKPQIARAGVTRSTATASPVTVGQRVQARGPLPTVNTVARRSTPLRTQTPIRAGTTVAAGNRTVLARANTPMARPQQSTLASGGKVVTPEQKILQLSKSGDLKVTRKVMTREELLAQRAAQQRQLRQVGAKESAQVQKVQQVVSPRGRLAKPSGVVAAAAPVAMQTETAEPESHHAQLCPITGKLIGQEESQLQMEQEQQQEQQREQLEAAAQFLLSGEQQLLTNEDGTALLVRGEDGTVYQVAGKNAEGQTILVTQGPDGEQQFAYVAAAEGEGEEALTLDNAVAEAVSQLPGEQAAEAGAATATTTTADGEQILVSLTEEELAQHQAAVLQQQQAAGAAGEETSTPTTAQIHITTSDSDGTESNIPAEVVQADLPSPGGTRRVVLLLQDGTFMMTEMHEEQFKTLNIPT